MVVVETLHTADQVAEHYAHFDQDQLTLDWEKRCQGHGKRTSDKGIAFAISLPHGTVLRQGDFLVLEAIKTVVEVKEANEQVYRIEPQSARDGAYYAYQIGNRHQPLMIEETELICLQNAATTSILNQLKVDYLPENRPFNSARVMTGHTH